MASKVYLKDTQYSSSKNLDTRGALHERFAPRGSNLFDFVWDAYQFVPSDRVLEVGCGAGTFWRHSEVKNCGQEILLTDFSPGMVEKAEENLSSTGWRAQFKVADADNLPYVSHSFSVVLAHYMLYHVESKQRVLSEFLRVLQSDGWVGILLQRPENMSSIYALLEDVASIEVPLTDGRRFSASVLRPLIQRSFGSVEDHEFEDELQVTDADMVVSFAQSSHAVQPLSLSDQTWANYRKRLCDIIDSVGYLAVKRASSLFVCRK